MTVLCPKCRRPLRVPPEKEGIPNLKARCSGCSTVFAVAEASLALAPAPTGEPPPPVARPAGPPGSFVPAVSVPVTPPRPPATSAATSRPPAVAPASAPASRRAAPRSPRPSGSAWRRCASHASTPSQGICSECGKGWCADCVKTQGSAMICPACDTLCLATAAKEAEEEKARIRGRPLTAELPTVFRYPFSDLLGFVLLAVIVGVFSVMQSFAAFGSAIAILLSQGMLYAYAFNAINRVSAGDLKTFMPSVGDVADLVEPMRGGIAALLISTGPLLLLGLMHPPADVLAALRTPRAGAAAAPSPEPTLRPELQGLVEPPAAPGEGGSEDGEDQGEEAASGPGGSGQTTLAAETTSFEEPGIPGWVFLAFALAIVWKILYSPVALVAAAISRSFFATLNPIEGLSAIRTMGSIYWAAMGVYTVIAVVETLIVGALGMIPLAGRFLAAFVQSYTYLSMGCLLGFAVFKKAPELGLD